MVSSAPVLAVIEVEAPYELGLIAVVEPGFWLQANVEEGIFS